ncbi:guanylyl cyclase [Lasius niger]|uniref:Guanylyl cyclase n=1 Tax=Lasius niger TaxID=67767 RepID=A0A0J7K551_LASNI|nr:guanylyl cyclase [Lasius niger]
MSINPQSHLEAVQQKRLVRPRTWCAATANGKDTLPNTADRLKCYNCQQPGHTRPQCSSKASEQPKAAAKAEEEPHSIATIISEKIPDVPYVRLVSLNHKRTPHILLV